MVIYKSSSKNDVIYQPFISKRKLLFMVLRGCNVAIFGETTFQKRRDKWLNRNNPNDNRNYNYNNNDRYTPYWHSPGYDKYGKIKKSLKMLEYNYENIFHSHQNSCLFCLCDPQTFHGFKMKTNTAESFALFYFI